MSVSLRYKETGDSRPLLLDFVEKAYAVHQPEYVALDVDSTHVVTHGQQENSTYNYHYGTTGYHPLFVFDGLTDDLLKVDLRKGSFNTSKTWPLLLNRCCSGIGQSFLISSYFSAITAALPHWNSMKYLDITGWQRSNKNFRFSYFY